MSVYMMYTSLETLRYTHLFPNLSSCVWMRGRLDRAYNAADSLVSFRARNNELKVKVHTRFMKMACMNFTTCINQKILS